MDDVGGLESGASRGANDRIESFDGLRAVAAFSVVIFHAAAVTGHASTGSAAPYLRHLDVGVSMFFVLSGFLLYRPIARAHFQAESAPGVRRYFRRRVLRIIPAYWIALGATAWVLHLTTIRTAGDAVVYFGLLQIYSTSHVFGGLVQAWSLCTEVAFYLMLPFYGWVLARKKRDAPTQLRAEVTGLVLLYAVSVGFRLLLLSRHAHIGYAWLPSYLDVFALGMGLAVLGAHATATGRRGRVASALGGSPAAVWLAAGALYWVLANLHLPQGLEPITTGQYMSRQLLAGTVALLVVGAAAMAEPGHPWLGGRFLASRPLRLLGLVSYGVFLWHMTWIEELIDVRDHRYAGSFGFVAVSAIVVSVLTAGASYYLVERRALAIGESRARDLEQPDRQPRSHRLPSDT